VAVGPVRCELLSLLTGILTGNSAGFRAAEELPDRGNSSQISRLAMLRQNAWLLFNREFLSVNRE
jgi:hypothetical protein